MSEIHPSRQNQIAGNQSNKTQSSAFREATKPKKKPKQEQVRSTSQKAISKNASRNDRRKKARQVAALLRAGKTATLADVAPAKEEEKKVKKIVDDKMEEDEPAEESEWEGMSSKWNWVHALSVRWG